MQVTDDQIMRLEPELVSFALKQGIQFEDAKDIASQVIVATWINREKPKRSLRTYMRQSMSNAIVDYFRRRNSKKHFSSFSPDVDGDNLAVDQRPSAFETCANFEVIDSLVRIMDGMAPVNQDAFVAMGIRGMSAIDYAESQGLPVGTVKSRFHRAKLYIKDRMNHEDIL